MSNFAEIDASHQSAPTNMDLLDQRMLLRSDSNALANADDAKLFVLFYSRSVKDEEKSKEAGRAIFKDQVFINIKIPGDKHNDVNRIAFPEDIQRFPLHWERFKKNQEQVVGTPLNVLPFLSEPQVEEYKSVFVRTVEQLANIPDVHLQKMMGSVQHKQQAKAWLDTFKGADKLREEFEQKSQAQDAEMAELRKQIAEMKTVKK